MPKKTDKRVLTEQEQAKLARMAALSLQAWPKYKFIALSLLEVDHRHYQRDPVTEKRLRIMEENFSKDAFQALTVGHRANGSYWVIEGQQRAIVAERVGLTHVPCLVVNSTGHQQEAVNYRLINGEGRKNLTVFDNYKAAVDGHEEPHLSIDKFVASVGLRIGPNHGKGTKAVGFVGQLIKNWRINAPASQRALADTAVICGDKPLNSPIFKGLWYLYHKGTTVPITPNDIERLAEINVRKIMAEINSLGAIRGSHSELHDVTCACALRNLLNKWRRTNRIELAAD